MSQVVIGTAGHIDHGKTALVKALTGTDTDRLEEEKLRGMTIDLGFAFLNKDITIIDVPGHERFIRNMVAGVSTIQIGLLVVSADDGVMPQTREHLNILTLIKVPQLIIALTKIDLIDDDTWLNLIEDEIKELLSGTNYKDSPIIRTSIENNTGIDQLKSTIIDYCQNIPEYFNRSFFRMPVDRSFIKKGFGTIVTGTVISGRVEKGAELECLPAEVKVKIRGMQTHGEESQKVSIGDRAAINIAKINQEDLWRGSELVSPKWMKPVKKMIVKINMVHDTKWTIKNGQRIRIHMGTDEILGKMVTFGGNQLTKSQSTNALIQLEKFGVAAMGDRFVLRSYSPMETIAGGIILDPNPTGSIKQIKIWGKDLSTDTTERFMQFLNYFRKKPRTGDQWMKIFHIPKSSITSIIDEMSLKVESKNGLIYSNENLGDSSNELIEILSLFHKKQPYRNGMSREELKNKAGFSTGLMDIVLKKCIGAKLVKNIDSGYRLVDFKISLSKNDLRKIDQMLMGLENSGYTPLTVVEMENNLSEYKNIQELLHVLKNENKATQISDELWLSNKDLNAIRKTIYNYLNTHDNLSVPVFKDLTGLTRKSAIPILEYLDKIQFTKRDGNDRLKGNKCEI
ncbi:selenocysteine-specific translation elongation factor [Candidatus Neomarinimicrobiota bacterium]